MHLGALGEGPLAPLPGLAGDKRAQYNLQAHAAKATLLADSRSPVLTPLPPTDSHPHNNTIVNGAL